MPRDTERPLHRAGQRGRGADPREEGGVVGLIWLLSVQYNGGSMFGCNNNSLCWMTSDRLVVPTAIFITRVGLLSPSAARDER